MNLLLLFSLFLFVTIQLTIVRAQFGINKKVPDGEINDNNDKGLNFNDAELQEAIQMFADMSPEEMMETIEALKEELKDDPDTVKELDTIIEELSKLSAEDIQKNLEEIMAEEAVAHSMRETLDMLSNADESSWEKIIANKDLILESVIESGMMSEEEIELFKNDKTAWEDELKHIWSELKKQAAASSDEL